MRASYKVGLLVFGTILLLLLEFDHCLEIMAGLTVLTRKREETWGLIIYPAIKLSITLCNRSTRSKLCLIRRLLREDNTSGPVSLGAKTSHSSGSPDIKHMPPAHFTSTVGAVLLQTSKLLSASSNLDDGRTLLKQVA